ncbi:MAG: hypothetical protein FJW34_13160 [Acidobacteria bacterium]|nr:hypothetical protein [Acidobacteriota bacterium]
MSTIITVSGTDLSKHADNYEYEAPDGSVIRVLSNRKVRWKCPDADLQIDFTGDSPFKSGRKHLPKVKKNKSTAAEETRDLKARESFVYTATVFLPAGPVLADPTLDVDPDPGPKKKKPKQRK